MSDPDDTLGLGRIMTEANADEPAPLNAGAFAPKRKRRGDRPSIETNRADSLEAGLQERAPKADTKKRAPARKKPAEQRLVMLRRSSSFETGRRETLTLKVHEDVKSRFIQIREDQEWVGGQMLEYAIDALEDMLQKPDASFWNHRKFTGVD